MSFTGLKWVKVEPGSPYIPTGAVKAGFEEDGQLLYVARAEMERKVVLGVPAGWDVVVDEQRRQQQDLLSKAAQFDKRGWIVGK